MIYKISRYLLLLFFSLTGFVSFASHCRISAIGISGNKVTKNFIVIRELPFAVGEDIETDSLIDLIEKGRGQLINLNLFNQVKISTQSFDSAGICWNQLSVEVVEKWYIWPIPFVSIADRNFTQWKENGYNLNRLNYALYLFRYNAGGINHTIKATFVMGYTRAMALEYRVPYWDKKKRFGSVFAISHQQNHEIAYNAFNNKLRFYSNPNTDVLKGWYVNTGLQFRPGYYTSHWLLLDYENIVVSDSVVLKERNPGYLGNGPSAVTLILSYEWLQRMVNNKNYPTKGYQAKASFQGGNIKSQKMESLFGVLAEYSNYLKLKHRIYVAASLTGMHRVTENKSFRYNTSFGYKYFVRGYEPYVINGNSFLLGKTSLRFAVLDEQFFTINFIPLKNYRNSPVSSFINLNFDMGYVSSPHANATNDLGNTLLFGGGIGWDWVFYYDKVLRFEYSINHLGQKGLYFQFTKPF